MDKRIIMCLKTLTDLIEDTKAEYKFPIEHNRCHLCFKEGVGHTANCPIGRIERVRNLISAIEEDMYNE